MANLSDPKFDRLGYSVAEVAKFYGLSSGFVRLEIARGKLRVRHLGRRVVILKKDLEIYLDSAGEEGTGS
jgi:excisionase family DNA binding protein